MRRDISVGRDNSGPRHVPLSHTSPWSNTWSFTWERDISWPRDISVSKVEKPGGERYLWFNVKASTQVISAGTVNFDTITHAYVKITSKQHGWRRRNFDCSKQYDLKSIKSVISWILGEAYSSFFPTLLHVKFRWVLPPAIYLTGRLPKPSSSSVQVPPC